MKNSRLSESIINILSIARLAPSVHNSQPWLVKIDHNQLKIFPSKHKVLKQGDPTGRETLISLGIFTEACVIALNHSGFGVKNVDFSDQNEIKIVLTASAKLIDDKSKELVAALKTRFTDRSVYKKISLSKTQLKKIESAWQSKNVEVLAKNDSEIIERCAQLTQQGLRLALSSPSFRKELTRHMVPSKKTPYGIPVGTLQSGKLKSLLIKQLIASDTGQKKEAELEYERWQSASAVVFVLGSGDSRQYWLEAGRAYLQASLAIERLGLRQATSAAIVEAADFHEDIEKLLNTKKRILCLLRVGISQAKPRWSGRFRAEDLLIT